MNSLLELDFYLRFWWITFELLFGSTSPLCCNPRRGLEAVKFQHQPFDSVYFICKFFYYLALKLSLSQTICQIVSLPVKINDNLAWTFYKILFYSKVLLQLTLHFFQLPQSPPVLLLFKLLQAASKISLDIQPRQDKGNLKFSAVIAAARTVYQNSVALQIESTGRLLDSFKDRSQVAWLDMDSLVFQRSRVIFIGRLCGKFPNAAGTKRRFLHFHAIFVDITSESKLYKWEAVSKSIVHSINVGLSSVPQLTLTDSISIAQFMRNIRNIAGARHASVNFFKFAQLFPQLKALPNQDLRQTFLIFLRQDEYSDTKTPQLIKIINLIYALKKDMLMNFLTIATPLQGILDSDIERINNRWKCCLKRTIPVNLSNKNQLNQFILENFQLQSLKNCFDSTYPVPIQEQELFLQLQKGHFRNSTKEEGLFLISHNWFTTWRTIMKKKIIRTEPLPDGAIQFFKKPISNLLLQGQYRGQYGEGIKSEEFTVLRKEQWELLKSIYGTTAQLRVSIQNNNLALNPVLVHFSNYDQDGLFYKNCYKSNPQTPIGKILQEYNQKLKVFKNFMIKCKSFRECDSKYFTLTEADLNKTVKEVFGKVAFFYITTPRYSNSMLQYLQSKKIYVGKELKLTSRNQQSRFTRRPCFISAIEKDVCRLHFVGMHQEFDQKVTRQELAKKDSTDYIQILRTCLPMKGFRNIGNSCYINSSIQALFGYEQFFQFISMSQCPSKKEKSVFFDMLRELALEVKYPKTEPGMGKFKKKVDRALPRFEGFQQEDAHEFINMLLQGVSDQFEQRNFIKEYFGGTTETQITCKSCGEVKTKVEAFYTMSLPLPNHDYRYIKVSVVNKHLQTVFYGVKLKRSLRLPSLLQELENELHFRLEDYILAQVDQAEIDLASPTLHKLFTQNKELYLFSKGITVGDNMHGRSKGSVIKSVGSWVDFQDNVKQIGYWGQIKRIIDKTYQIAALRSPGKTELVQAKSQQIFGLGKVCPPKTYEVQLAVQSYCYQEHEVQPIGFPYIFTTFKYLSLSHILRAVKDLLVQELGVKPTEQVEMFLTKGVQLGHQPKCVFCGKGVKSQCRCGFREECLWQLEEAAGGVVTAVWQERASLNMKRMAQTHSSYEQLIVNSPVNFKTSDCLDKFMEHEELEIKCDKCKHGTAQLRHVVGKAPALLVLHYSRFVFMDGDLKKIGFKVGLEQQLNFGPWTKDREELQYELVAAILHYGDGFSGHYVAMVKDRARGRWMVANDETVRVATQEDYSTSNAYMCFYQRKPLPIDIYVRSLF